jgi:hypothetical protein
MAQDAWTPQIEGRHRAVKIYFVARNDEPTSSRVSFVVTYWCSLEDDVLEDAAA